MTAREAAHAAIKEIVATHDAGCGWDYHRCTVRMVEGAHAEKPTFGPEVRFYTPLHGLLVAEQIVADWLLAHGLPAITIAALYDGTPYPVDHTATLQWAMA